MTQRRTCTALAALTLSLLAAGSPALSAGTLIADNGGRDWFGNAVSATAAPTIGAYEGEGVK
ncbi:hypothetical protein [Streptomyces sp. NPDC056194]|uniref:hypothetical protein n=1 Tax=unclassified Streptomyces TaxID=2593676 RepID=UPI0035DFA3AD